LHIPVGIYKNSYTKLAYTTLIVDVYIYIQVHGNILQNTVRIQNAYNVCLRITYGVNIQQISVEMHLAFYDTARCQL